MAEQELSLIPSYSFRTYAMGGALRICVLREATIASTSRTIANTTAVCTIPIDCKSTPVKAMPTGRRLYEMRRKALFTRPCNSSGISASR